MNWTRKELLLFVNKQIDDIESVAWQIDGSDEKQCLQQPIDPKTVLDRSQTQQGTHKCKTKHKRKETWDINKDFTSSLKATNGLRPLEWHSEKNKERNRQYREMLATAGTDHSNPSNQPTIAQPAHTRRLVFRDLRHLDLQFDHLEHEPVLLVRRHCAILSFHPITAILLADCVLLLIPPLVNSLGVRLEERGEFVLSFENYMADWTAEHSDYSNSSHSPNSVLSSAGLHHSEDPMPFEHCALEGLLTIIRCYEEQEVAALQHSLSQVLHHFSSGGNVPLEVSARFRAVKSDLAVLRRRIESYKAVLGEASEDEELMAVMNLSVLKRRPELLRYEFVEKQSENVIHLFTQGLSAVHKGFGYARVCRGIAGELPAGLHVGAVPSRRDRQPHTKQ